MIGYSTGEAYESGMHEALGKPIEQEHPAGWKGNKEYGAVFDRMDKDPGSNQRNNPNKIDWNAPNDTYRQEIDWKEQDMEKGPKSGQDYDQLPMINPDKLGWHKVAGDVVKFPVSDEKRKENTDFGKKIEQLDPNFPKAPVVPIRQASNDPTIGLGSPEKTAGASKSDPGTQVPHGIDRSSFQAELKAHPELVNKMAHMVKGEVGLGNQEHSIVQLETAFNRAQSRGHSLSQALLSKDENRKLGYYQGGRQGTYTRPASQAEIEAFRQNVLGPVLEGSNLSDRGFGPMTGNASAGTARRQAAQGTPGYKLGNESYFNEETGKHLTALQNLPQNQYDSKGLHIDRNHDVPLAAAALDKGDGKMYGIAVDRRAPINLTIGKITYDPADFVYLHEGVEHPHMENLIGAGMSEKEAYEEAHDAIATPMEKAAVQAFAVKNGEDPDKFWKEHQQYWKDVTKRAQENDPSKVHPHTYLKPYAPALREKMHSAKVSLKRASLDKTLQ